MLDEREREMYRLRISEGLTLRELGERFGIGPERARQVLNRYVRRMTDGPANAKEMSRTAAAIRRAKDLAQAEAQAEGLLAAWRQGEQPERIAKQFGLRCQSVAQVIRTNRTSADRVASVRAQQRSRETTNKARPPHP
ncbi:MAG: sigma factor-like helix-turn-helix DNA-binding protein [Solirubrobacteraceae bacterium]